MARGRCCLPLQACRGRWHSAGELPDLEWQLWHGELSEGSQHPHAKARGEVRAARLNAAESESLDPGRVDYLGFVLEAAGFGLFQQSLWEKAAQFSV